MAGVPSSKLTVSEAPFQPSPHESDNSKMTLQEFLMVTEPSAFSSPSAVIAKLTLMTSVAGQFSSIWMVNTQELMPSGSMVPISMVGLSRVT